MILAIALVLAGIALAVAGLVPVAGQPRHAAFLVAGVLGVVVTILGIIALVAGYGAYA